MSVRTFEEVMKALTPFDVDDRSYVDRLPTREADLEAEISFIGSLFATGVDEQAWNHLAIREARVRYQLWIVQMRNRGWWQLRQKGWQPPERT